MAGKIDEKFYQNNRGEVFCLICFIQILLQEQREELKKEIKEKINGLIKKHIIDMELYEDSGGGEMCEVCGKQGKELDELCDRNNNYNSALAEIKKLIEEL